LSKVVGIVSRADKQEALELASKVVQRLESEGLSIVLEPALAAYVNRKTLAKPLEDMRVDLIVTVGGDGTILRTCLYIPKPDPPILPINMSVRGFLTEVPPEEALQAVERYLKGDYGLERCSKIASSIGEKRLPDALNEVFVTSRSLAKMIHLRVCKNGTRVADCRSDGIIVSSQVGSTGYSLSAGGPILDPDLDAFVLTPVCPLTYLRPIVFSANASLTVELLKPDRATVVIDGHYQAELSHEEPFIKMRKSEHQSVFVRFEDNFYDRLKERLLFPREESTENE